MRTWLGILALGATLLESSPADACSGDPALGVTRFGVLPADASVAARNTRIWVPLFPSWRTDGTALEPADVTVRVGDSTIETAVTTLVVDGEAAMPVLMLEPVELLPAGATVRVMLRGEVGSQFTVASEVDTTAPAAPRIERVEVVGGYFGGFSCPVSARVTIDVAPTDDVLALAGTTTTTVPTGPMAMAHGAEVTAVDLAEGDHSLYLLAIDLAGNVTGTPVPEFTVPTEQSGCSTGRGAGWLPFALLVLVTAFARSGSRCARSGVAARRARRTDRGCSTAR